MTCLFGSGIAAAAEFYVSPEGNDSWAGTEQRPLKSISAGLELAQPGDSVKLGPGIYLQDFSTVRDGTNTAPIRLIGTSDSIVVGGGAVRPVQIRNDYFKMEGFVLDGHFLGALDTKEAYREKLVYVMGSEPGNGVVGFGLKGMTLRNSGGECLRMRYNTTNAEITDTHFENCGVWDFKFADGGKNGEAIYIGTAPEQLGAFGAPTADADGSNNNWIHHNTFNTQGNECVDIKEGSTGNLVEYNVCTGQLDSESGGFDSRGNQNIFRYNEAFNNLGAGIRLGGDTEVEGIANEIYGNMFRNNAAGGVRIQRSPQQLVCENSFEANGTTPIAGTFSRMYSGADPCDLTLASDTSQITNGVVVSSALPSSPPPTIAVATTAAPAVTAPLVAVATPVQTKAVPAVVVPVAPQPQPAPLQAAVSAPQPVAQMTAAGVQKVPCPVSKNQCMIGIFTPGQGFSVLFASEQDKVGTIVGFADVLMDSSANLVNPSSYSGQMLAVEYDQLSPAGLISPVLLFTVGQK